MLSNNLLGDHLNASKNNNPIPEKPKAEKPLVSPPKSKPKDKTNITLLSIYALFIIKILAMGYALKFLFNYEWSIIQTVVVGLGVFVMIEQLASLLRYEKKS